MVFIRKPLGVAFISVLAAMGLIVGEGDIEL